MVANNRYLGPWHPVVVHTVAKVLPLSRVEAGHVLLQAELEADAVGAHPADTRVNYWRAGIRKAQVHRVATHLDAELAYGLHGDEVGRKPKVD